MTPEQFDLLIEAISKVRFVICGCAIAINGALLGILFILGSKR